jgi:hypothetical protein
LHSPEFHAVRHGNLGDGSVVVSALLLDGCVRRTRTLSKEVD